MNRRRSATGVHRSPRLGLRFMKQALNNVMRGLTGEWFGEKRAGSRRLHLSRLVVQNITTHQDNLQLRLQLVHLPRDFRPIHRFQKIIHDCQVKILRRDQLQCGLVIRSHSDRIIRRWEDGCKESKDTRFIIDDENPGRCFALLTICATLVVLGFPLIRHAKIPRPGSLLPLHRSDHLTSSLNVVTLEQVAGFNMSGGYARTVRNYPARDHCSS